MDHDAPLGEWSDTVEVTARPSEQCWEHGAGYKTALHTVTGQRRLKAVRWRRRQASPVASDAERAALGSTVRDPVGPPTTHPVVAIECGKRPRHANKAKGEIDNGLLHRVP